MNQSINLILTHSNWIIMPSILMYCIINLTNMTLISFMNMLIFYSLLLCLEMSKFQKSYMYSFFIFLLISTALLILFAFFISLTPIKGFYKKNIKNNYINIIIFLLSSFTFMFILYKFNFKNIFFNIKIKSFIIFNMQKSSIFQIYNYPNNILIVFLILYLLLALIIIIKISLMKNNKPFRSLKF
uniref:NADH dehydrogenase subunit 6 n=1 Tax=Abispa ephippium TaxID=485912 RepID=B6RQY9_9HYME|nr:NADH dehydrogenase subunit 6 [Abispa ephippium]